MLKKNPGYFAFLILAVFFISLLSNKGFTDKFIVPKNFYFYFLMAPMLATIVIAGMNNKTARSYTFSIIDIALPGYYAYSFIRVLFTGNLTVYNTEFINQTLLLVFYFCIKFTYNDFQEDTFKKHYRILVSGIMLLILLNALYGILQYAGFLPSQVKDFRLGGSFGNPGPYSNFLVLIIPFSYIVVTNRKYFPGIQYLLGVLAIVLTIIVLPLTNARTSWICFAASAVIYLFIHFAASGKIRKILTNTLLKIFVVLAIISLTAVTSYYLYHYKKDSASGRMFIWKVTLNMIKDKPVFGHGFDSYAIKHNDYQADYFKRNPNDIKNAYLSDNTTFAFNEYLQIASDMGVVGLLLFMFPVVFALLPRFHEKEKNKAGYFLFLTSKIIIIVFITGSLFSYPLRSLPSQALLYYALATISATGDLKVKYTVRLEKKRIGYLAVLFAVLLIPFYSNQLKRFSSEKQWLKTFNLMRKGNFRKAYTDYAELYPVMKYNKYFLFNYGAELTLMKKYDEAVGILNETLPYLNDADVYLYLGHAYEETGQLGKAEECYLHAGYIVPSKLFPKYSLVKVYQKTNNEKKAVELAKEISEMNVKVETDIARNIKKEMNDYLLDKSEMDSITGQ